MATYAQLMTIGPLFSGGLICTLKCYHYIVGTTTLKDVYIDREKGSTAAQPVVSDANGIVSFYADGLYKFRIDGATDGSTYSTLYTYDKWAVGDQGTQIGEGAAIVAASTLVLGTDGDFFHVTGATGITALSGGQSRVTLCFDSTPTLTHSGNLILQNGANYTVAAGVVISFVNDGAGVWRETSRTPPVNPVGTAGQLLRVNAGATATEWSAQITLATPQVSTSGTSIDFTSIPAWAKRITISLIGVSISGTAAYWLQLGDSGGVETTGYLGSQGVIGGAASGFSSAFIIAAPANATPAFHGSLILTLENAATFTWSCFGSMGRSDSPDLYLFAGSKATSAALDRVRITTSNGSDTFDAGAINIAYE